MGLNMALAPVADLADDPDSAHIGSRSYGAAPQACAPFLRCEGLPYLILTAADGDGPAFRVAEKCGFLLYERRVRVGRRLTGMPGEAYAYFRKY